MPPASPSTTSCGRAPRAAASATGGSGARITATPILPGSPTWWRAALDRRGAKYRCRLGVDRRFACLIAMKKIVVLGAGKIGRMVAHFLGSCGDYALRIGDAEADAVALATGGVPNSEGRAVDFASAADLDALMAGADAVISCAPFHCNPLIATRAKANRLHYLDLTEDVEVTREVVELARDASTAFVPQCGLAP